MKKYILGCAWILATLVLTVDARPLNTAETEIIQVLKNQFDRPVTPLDVPVVVVGVDFAVADWLQDNRGGRALLRHDADGWQTLMCGSAQLKSAHVLESAGVPPLEAAQISRDLAAQEVSLTAEKLAIIDSFEGIIDMLTNAEHHHEHH